MGEIWLAKQRGAAGFERLVVLKRIIANVDEEPAAVEMFLDEARIASHLHHPNIVQVSELGQDGASYYLVMEYLAGQTLGRVARRAAAAFGALGHTLAVELVMAAARGLGHAHRCTGPDGVSLGIVHRDVSPQNVLVTYDGTTKVLDFGIAKATSRLARTRTGIVKGKISYMSPEQALGQSVTASSDVFSLGIILFELLTETRLWGDLDDMAILQRLAVKAPLPSVTTRTNVDSALARIVTKATDADSSTRYSDGVELAEALEAWQREQPRPALSLRETMQQCFATEIEQLARPVALGAPLQLVRPVSNESLPMGGQPAPRQNLWALVFVTAGVATVALATLLYFSGAGRSATRRMEPGVPIVVAPATTPVDAGALSAEAVVDAGPPTTKEVRIVAAVDDAADAGAIEPEKPSAASRPARRGRLTLDTDPWTQVFEGPRDLGETPLVDVSLPAGKHKLRLVNASEHIDTVVEVEVPVDGRAVKKLAF